MSTWPGPETRQHFCFCRCDGITYVLLLSSKWWRVLLGVAEKEEAEAMQQQQPHHHHHHHNHYSSSNITTILPPSPTATNSITTSSHKPNIMAKMKRRQELTWVVFYLPPAEWSLTGSCIQFTARGRQAVDWRQGATHVDVELASIGWVTVVQHHPVLIWRWLGQAKNKEREKRYDCNT